MADGAVHEKRAAFCTTRHAVWKVVIRIRRVACSFIQVSPRIGGCSRLLATIRPKGLALDESLR